MNNIRENDTRTTGKTPARTQTVPVLNTEELFKGSREVILIHRYQEYRLRITRNEKLILTK